MTSERALQTATALMLEFADRTGLRQPHNAPRRYLWTDAFAVCNFLALHRRTEKNTFLELALRLVEQVHRVLGRHRADDRRTRWISGLDEEQGRRHPTSGGLRIGKKLNERGPGEPFDERLEWDRDGQYYHYLTKWMHALDCLSRVTGDTRYHRWSIELGTAAHRAFTHPSGTVGPKRMYWKMSIDLSRPLVASMGHHDPLDGLVTAFQLRSTAARFPDDSDPGALEPVVGNLADMCWGRSWDTDDPLGIGGLLADACKLGQMVATEHLPETALLEELLASSARGLDSYANSRSLQLPSEYRLAFRELGLGIGLTAAEMLQARVEEQPSAFEGNKRIDLHLKAIIHHLHLRENIETFWLEAKNQAAETWTGHIDINTVMLATSLVPEGYLKLY
ncbi:MAG TPA: hypothetical protein ACFCUC_03085 [Desulfobacterales bacterium]